MAINKKDNDRTTNEYREATGEKLIRYPFRIRKEEDALFKKISDKYKKSQNAIIADAIRAFEKNKTYIIRENTRKRYFNNHEPASIVKTAYLTNEEHQLVKMFKERHGVSFVDALIDYIYWYKSR